MSLKGMMMKHMMKSQMKNVPKDQQDAIIAAVEKDPELFQKIGEEIQAEIKKGTEQMAASMKVMQKYKSELQGLMGK